MKWLVSLVLSCVVFTAPAQDYYAELEKQMIDLYTQKKYEESLSITTKILKVFPENINANINHAAALLFLNRPTEAKRYIDNALTLDPSGAAPLTAKSYLFANDGNLEKAKETLVYAIKFDTEAEDIERDAQEMVAIGKALGKEDTFQSLANWYRQTRPSIKEKLISLVSIVSTYNNFPEDPQGLMDEARKLATQLHQQKLPDVAALAYLYASQWLRNWGYPSEALTILTEGYTQIKQKGFGNNYYILSNVVASMMSYNIDRNELTTAAQFGDEFMANIGKSPLPSIDVDGLINIAMAYGLMRDANKDLSIKYASAAYDLAVKTNYVNGIARAANAVTLACIDFYSPESSAKGIRFGEYGYKVAEENKLDVKSSLLSNLALLYWSQGEAGKQKSVSILRYQITKAKEENRLDNASLYLNNLGSMYYSMGQHDLAINHFEESSSLANSGRVYKNPKDRIAFYDQQMSANQWLVRLYSKKGDAEKTFEAMERSRARVLNERLSHDQIETPTVYDLQSLLKPDEACIMYDVFSGHEITILVITKKYAHVLFHDDPRFVGDIYDKYFNKSKEEQIASNVNEEQSRGFEWISLKNQRTQVVRGYDKSAVAPKSEFERIAKLTRKYSESPGLNDQLLGDFLTRYQRYLITPINNRLTGIKTLIISPNNILSFIPFEALRTFDGKYLVEKYNIRYLHSASVLKQLEARQYTHARKPLLAMGGAIYQDMDEERVPINTSESFNLLQAEVEENIAAGKSLRKAYASLMGTRAMNPLQGTAEEVKNISKNLPGCDIFIGQEMTENRIKSLSQSGQLKNYKILHLATHGFVISEIPDLSGVAMCIFPKEQDGEDGFLNATEISNLQLNADLAVLSACQTALGKLYVGEGVSGLTQSLLLAGSNAALVSLWPVDDTSTMLFMSHFYKEVAKGKPYPQIVNELKRKFIKGDFGKEFQHPSFWAPFIYYGK